MRKYLTLLLIPFLIAAAPARQTSYTTGELIKSADVTANEDAIFNYLTLGVDTYADDTIVNADINSSANIQAGKLNLASVTQAVLLNNSGVANVLEINNDSTQHGLYLHQDGVLDAGKHGLFVTSATNQTTASLAKFSLTDVNSAVPLLDLTHAGTGHGITITHTKALAAGKHGVYVESTVANTIADTALVKLVQNHASSTEPALEIDNDGTGAAIEIDNDGTGADIEITRGSNLALTMTSTGLIVSIGNLGLPKHTTDQCTGRDNGEIYWDSNNNYLCVCISGNAEQVSDGTTDCAD